MPEENVLENWIFAVSANNLRRIVLVLINKSEKERERERKKILT